MSNLQLRWLVDLHWFRSEFSSAVISDRSCCIIAYMFT